MKLTSEAVEPGVVQMVGANVVLHINGQVWFQPMLVKRPAGVVPDIEVYKGSTTTLKPWADKSSKQGYQWSHKGDLCPPKTKEKK